MLTPGVSPMAFAPNNPVSFNDPTGLAPSGLFPLAAFADYENEREKAGMLTAEDRGNGGEKQKEHKAWEKKRDWNRDDFGKFQEYIVEIARKLGDKAESGNKTVKNVLSQDILTGYFQCSQLAVMLLVSYAKEEGLPLTLFRDTKSRGRVTISSENMTWEEFEAEAKFISPKDIALNATPVSKNEREIIGALLVSKTHVNTVFKVEERKYNYIHTINASGGYIELDKYYGSFTTAHRSGSDNYLTNARQYIWNVFINNFIKNNFYFCLAFFLFCASFRAN
jgi:hypothetical protein